MKFEIFAGLNGSFNNEVSIGIEEFDSKEEALDAAYEEACDIYDRYSGTQGLNSQESIVLDRKKDKIYADLTEDELEEEAWEIYDQERETWLKFHVVEITE